MADTVQLTDGAAAARAAGALLHRRVSTAVKEWLERGELQPGDFLPTEPELERRFGVSRITVRRAMQDLEAAGLIERRRGRGTAVRPRRAAQALNSVTSFGETIRGRGWLLTSVDVSLRPVPATAAVAQDLQLAEGAEVLRLHRLRLADGRPISHQINYLLPAIVAGLGAEDLTGPVSLYEVLEDRFGVTIGRADETIGAHAATRTEAELLAVAPGTAVLTSRRVSYLEDGRPFETSFATIRADCYEYTIHLSGRQRRLPPDAAPERRDTTPDGAGSEVRRSGPVAAAGPS